MVSALSVIVDDFVAFSAACCCSCCRMRPNRCRTSADWRSLGCGSRSSTAGPHFKSSASAVSRWVNCAASSWRTSRRTSLLSSSPAGFSTCPASNDVNSNRQCSIFGPPEIPLSRIVRFPAWIRQQWTCLSSETLGCGRGVEGGGRRKLPVERLRWHQGFSRQPPPSPLASIPVGKRYTPLLWAM